MQVPGKTRARDRQSDMFPLISRYLKSGLTQEAFCRQENLTLPVFGYWLRKYKRCHLQKIDSAQSPATAPAFLQV